MKGEPYPVQCESQQHRAQVRTAGSQSPRFGYANLPLLLLRCQSIQLSVIPVSAPVTPFIPHQAPGSSYNPQKRSLRVSVPGYPRTTYTDAQRYLNLLSSLTDISLRSAAAHSFYLSDPFPDRSRLQHCDWLICFLCVAADWPGRSSSPYVVLA